MESLYLPKLLQTLISPPEFQDQKKNHQAYILNFILWSLILLSILYLGASLILTPESAKEDLTVSGFGTLINIFLLVIMRRGFVRLASILQVTSFWLLFTYVSYSGEGIVSPAYSMGFILVILVAGILLEGPGALVMTCLALATGAGMYYFQSTAVPAQEYHYPLIGYWVISAFMFPLSAILQYLAVRTMRKAFSQAVDSEKKYRSILNNIQEVYYRSDPQGRLVMASPSFLTVFGYTTLDEVLGHPIAETFFQKPEEGQVLALLLQEQQRVNNFEIELKRKDGSLINCDATSQYIFDEKGEIIGIEGILRDITARKSAEKALSDSEEKFRSLVEQSAEGFALLDENGCVIEWNPAIERLTGLLSREVKNQPYWEVQSKMSLPERRTPERMQSAKEQIQHAYLHKQSNLFNNPMEINIQRADGQVRTINQTVFPVQSGDLFRIGSVTRDVTDQKQAEEALEHAYDATLEGWSHALELRERETAEHSHRVVELTLSVAKALDVPDAQLIHIRRGALLHDIGKMGIPDSVLLKPGPLTDEEWIIMQRHPILAYDLLKDIAYLRPALDIPYCHHERWDGSGYPNHLKGEAIPMSARIFAIVDVWDALTSNRPYSPAWAEDEAFSYIICQSGKQFDPSVVDMFSQILENEKQSLKSV